VTAAVVDTAVAAPALSTVRRDRDGLRTGAPLHA
jgi:hypothetical protein